MSVAVFEGGSRWDHLWRRGRGELDDDFCRWVIKVVDESCIVDNLLGWREEQRRGPGGRHQHFPLRAVIVALVITVLTGEAPHLTRACEVMFRRLSPDMRRELGIPDPPRDGDRRAWAARYRSTRHRLNTHLEAIDPSWLPRNRRLLDPEFNALAAAQRAKESEGEWALRYERLTWVLNQLLEASLRLIPEDIRARYDGSVGVDATFLASPARAEKRAGKAKQGVRAPIVTHSADPDAAYYSRPSDERDADGGIVGGRMGYGYEGTMVVSGRKPSSPATPAVVMAMAPLHRPGHAPGQNAVVALDNLRQRGYHAGYLAADRAYSSAKDADFQRPVRALGFEPVFDYKKDQLGIKDSYNGFLQIEGAWFCPAIPQPLINATLDYREGRIDDATRRARIEERRNYLARWKGQPEEDGHYRLMCPAASVHPIARCDLKPKSISPATSGRLRIFVSRELSGNPLVCCTQQSVTMPPEAGVKFAQKLLYGTDEWHEMYSTMRNTNEGMHGYFKDGAYEALGDPRRRRLLGTAAQSFQVALTLFAANVRKIAAFLEDEARIEQARIPRGRTRPPRRRTQGLEAWLPRRAQLGPEDPGPPRSA